MKRTAITAAVLALALLVCWPLSALAGNCYNCQIQGNGCWSCPADSDTGGTGCKNVSCAGCTVEGSCGTGSGCFIGTMAVATPAGLVAIQDLEVGATVLSRDEDGRIVAAQVIDTHLSESWNYLVINDDLQVTDTHPFFVDGDWVLAGELEIGDTLVNDEGETVRVASLDRVDKGVRVYNISVDGSNTFFANGIFVHNKGPNISN